MRSHILIRFIFVLIFPKSPRPSNCRGEGSFRVHFPYDPHSPLKIGLKIHEMTCFFTMLLSGFLWHISCKQTDRCFFQSVLTDVPFSRC